MISYHTCPLASEEGKETGGMNVYVYELSSALSRLGYEVDVVTRSQDARVEKVVQVEKGFRVIHLVAGPEHPQPRKKVIDFVGEFIESLKAFIKDEHRHYDLIHAHYYLSGLIALGIRTPETHAVPFVLTFHTLALMKNLVARASWEEESRARIDAEFTLLQEANAIIAPSASDKHYLMYLYEASEEKIVEIAPGVNLKLFRPMQKTAAKSHLGISQTRKTLLFVGRIEPLKGIDMLLYAVKILKAQHPDMPLTLLIVGGDISQHITKWSSQMHELDALRHILHIENEVQFVGQRPQKELPYFYNAADIVVIPSHYESFGMVVAESMACGTPVITTNVAGVSDLIDERRSMLITSVHNPLLLASQIRQLLTNETMYKKVQRNSIASTKDLSWSVVAKHVAEVYGRVLKRL